MPSRRIAAVAALCSALAFVVGCHDVHLQPMHPQGEIGIYDDLFAVSVPDSKTVVTVGYYGAIYQSEDGGDTWAKRPSGTLRSLYDVSMADDRRGWIVGQSATILRTTDGGKTWTPQANPKQERQSHLFGVHAVDANTAWVVGEWGTRLFTDDGGVSWQDFSLTIDEEHPQFVWLPPVDQERVRRGEKVFEDVSLNDVFCSPLPSQRCWIAGEFGYIFRSESEGLAWERGEIQGSIEFEPVRVPYEATDISDADEARLEEFAASILPESHLNVEIEPVASSQEIAALGKQSDPSALFEILEARATAVRGAVEAAGILSDRIRVRGSPPWDFEDFLEDDPEFLQRYLDSRRDEQPGVRVKVAQNPYLFTVRFQNDERGLISGLGGLMLRSEDGGKTWAYERTGRKQALFSVALSSGRSITVGEKGLVRVSNDGGLTWAEPKDGFPVIFTFMRDVRFGPEGRTAFIVGQQGMVLRSTDGGVQWRRVLPPDRTQTAAAGGDKKEG